MRVNFNNSSTAGTQVEITQYGTYLRGVGGYNGNNANDSHSVAEVFNSKTNVNEITTSIDGSSCYLQFYLNESEGVYQVSVNLMLLDGDDVPFQCTSDIFLNFDAAGSSRVFVAGDAGIVSNYRLYSGDDNVAMELQINNSMLGKGGSVKAQVTSVDELEPYFSDESLTVDGLHVEAELTNIKQVPFENGGGANSALQKNGNLTVWGAHGVAEGKSDVTVASRGLTTASTDSAIYNNWLTAGTPTADIKFTLVKGEAAHAEGMNGLAIGAHSHVEGNGCVAGDNSAHAEGTGAQALGKYSHAEGLETEASGNQSHAEGISTVASASSSHAEGNSTTANKACSHAEGGNSVAGTGTRPNVVDETDAGKFAHAEGNGTQASGNASHSEGKHTLASGENSHAEGLNSVASGPTAHVEGEENTATGDCAHAEGYKTYSIGGCSHTEGNSTTASTRAHAEGYKTKATGQASHAEGESTKALKQNAHAEGKNTEADGNEAHAEGNNTKAKKSQSHAEGYYTVANGEESHAEGGYTTTTNLDEHAQGRNNVSHYGSDDFGHSGNTIHSVGISNDTAQTMNAFEIMQNGDTYLYGVGKYDGINIASVDTLQQAVNTSGKKYTIDMDISGKYLIVPLDNIPGTEIRLDVCIWNTATSVDNSGSGPVSEEIPAISPIEEEVPSIEEEVVTANETVNSVTFSHTIFDVETVPTTSHASVLEVETYKAYMSGDPMLISGESQVGGVSMTMRTRALCVNFGPVWQVDAIGKITVSRLDGKPLYHDSFSNNVLYFTPSSAVTTTNYGPATSVEISRKYNSSMISTTWSNLKSLRDNGNLVPGMQYRITDYRCTTTQNNTTAATNLFDIIVVADSTTKLNENARATQHTTSSSDYFYNSNLSAWQLKYCLDNDTDRFVWADRKRIKLERAVPHRDADNDAASGLYRKRWVDANLVYYTASDTPSAGDYAYESTSGGNSTIIISAFTGGCGVIYYMKDEFDNEAPYDFKDIKFARWEMSNPTGYTWNDGTEDYDVDSDQSWVSDFDLKSGLYGLSERNTDDVNVVIVRKDPEETYNNRKIVRYTISTAATYCYTFGGLTDDSLDTGETKENILEDKWLREGGFPRYARELTNNVFLGTARGNKISYYSFGNTFGTGSDNNKLVASHYNFSGGGNAFGQGCNNNIIGDGSYRNTFGSGSTHNVLGSQCSYNTFGINCVHNKLEDYCEGNAFCSGASLNSLGQRSSTNYFGYDSYGNTLGGYNNHNYFETSTYGNTFGYECGWNTINGDCYSNTLGSGCGDNNFGVGCHNNVLGNSCGGNILGENCTNNSFGCAVEQTIMSDYCSYNSFGNNCSYIKIGESCLSNTFGNDVHNITFGPSLTATTRNSHYQYITVESGNNGIVLDTSSAASLDDDHVFRNVRICSGFDNPIPIVDPNGLNQDFLTRYHTQNDKEIALPSTPT